MAPYQKTTTSVVDLFALDDSDPEAPHRAIITVLSGSGTGEIHEVTDTVIVGRDADIDLTLADRGVSGQHCQLVRVAEDVVTVEDLGSTNGTWCNGEPVTRPRMLLDGDRIRVGVNTLLLFALSLKVFKRFSPHFEDFF